MRLRGAAVLDNVVQALLDDAEQAELHFGRHRPRHSNLRKMDLNALRHYFATMPADGRPEAEALQSRRVQTMGNIVDLARNLRGPVGEPAYGTRHRGRRPDRQPH